MNKPIDIYEVKEIEKVVTFLTTEKDIDSIAENSGVSTINVSSTVLLADRENVYLTAGLYVKIGVVNYIVSNVVENTSFDIVATGLTETKWALALEFRPGSLAEVDSLLINANLKPEEQFGKFPLLWMIIEDPNERDHAFAPPVNLEYSLKLAMINTTKKEYKVIDRLDNNFIPTLKPYVTLFMCALKSVYFRLVFDFGEDEITDNYKEYFRYFYGSSDKNKMVFDSITDAIEIKMPLKLKNQYNCSL